MTGFGHPDWVRTHEAALETCPVVSALVEGGATCIGKTVVDELAFGYEFYAWEAEDSGLSSSLLYYCKFVIFS